MGYDLHVTRADHWASSSGCEISVDAWQKLIAGDPHLRVDGENGPHAVVWLNVSGASRGWFDWHGGAVYTTNPDRETVRKLLAMAQLLDARVQGDEGEFYEKAEDWQQQAP